MRMLSPFGTASALFVLAACAERADPPFAPLAHDTGRQATASMSRMIGAGFGSAVIDGQLSPDEWAAAASVSFTLTTLGDAHESTLHVMNDDTYLYLAVVVRDDDFAPGNEVQGDVLDIFFDNDNDGSIAYSSTLGDDFVQVNAPFDGGFWDGFTCKAPCEPATSFQLDVGGGTTDLFAAFTHSNPTPGAIGTYVFELRKTLRSGDTAHDFQLSPGDAVGIFLEFIDTPIGEPGGALASWPGPDACISYGFGGPPCESATIILASDVLPVSIDIRPGSSTNVVQPESDGVIAVAVLTTLDLDAGDVDGATLTLSSPRASASVLRWSREDVEGDGDADLVAHFATAAVRLQCGDAAATVAGLTTSGRRIRGADVVTVVPCRVGGM